MEGANKSRVSFDGYVCSGLNLGLDLRNSKRVQWRRQKITCFCFLCAETEFWKARDGGQGSWSLSLQPGSVVMGTWGARAQITPHFHVTGVTSLGLFLPLAMALAPFLSVVQTVRRKDGHVAENRARGISERETGLPLNFFFKFKGFLPDTVSSSLFSDTLIFSLKMGKVMVAGPLIILFCFHGVKVQRCWSGLEGGPFDW